MKHAFLSGSALVLALGVAAAFSPDAEAQTKVTAGVRGKVVDEQGKTIEGVKLDLEFKGESRQKITKTQLTDKKGGYIRVGVPGGPWRLTFTKEGYKPYSMDTYLSDGAFSELPDIVMKAGAAAAGPATPAANEVTPTIPKESATMKDVYNKAVEASRAGNLDEAEALYKQVLETLPDLAEIHYNLGHVYIRKKDFDAAEASFRRAVELKPEKPEGYIALAAIYGVNPGKSQEAADLLSKAPPGFEQNPTFQFVLGTTCVNAGRNKDAAEAFRKVVALDPANPEPHYYLGTIAVGENRMTEALTELQSYIAATGQNPQNLVTAKRLIDVLKPKK